MKQQSCLGRERRLSWLWIGFLIFCLGACSQNSVDISSGRADETVEASSSPVVVTENPTQTPIPATDTAVPPSPTSTQTPELPTETSPPPEIPTLTPTLWPTSETYFDGARVTFINNAGFMITVGDKKILIDALYDTYNQNTAPPQEILQRVVNAQPPFDQIDLIIATHDHADHFSADLVRAHLRQNEGAVFVSSPAAVQQIERAGDDFSERLIAVDLDQDQSIHLSVDGVEIDCLYITHGDASILNIGFAIAVDGYTFFHSGDMSVDSMMGEAVSLADLQGYRLPQKGIDLAFLPSYIFVVEEYISLIENGIQARYVTPMHYPYQYPPSGIAESVANAVVFQDTLENWVVPPE